MSINDYPLHWPVFPEFRSTIDIHMIPHIRVFVEKYDPHCTECRHYTS